MSRTNHHRNQKTQHLGHDYGSRYNCNRKYTQSYGKYGRDLADSERRNESKVIVKDELNELMLGYKPESGERSIHWYDETYAMPTSNKHDTDKLSDILDYIESSNISVELFGAFIREYAECKDIDQAWNAALCEWDCDGGELWNFITRVSG